VPSTEDKPKPRFPLSLDDATYRALKRRAFETDRNVTDLVREAVGEYLRKPARRSA
jgi:hypothetical protein